MLNIRVLRQFIGVFLLCLVFENVDCTKPDYEHMEGEIKNKTFYLKNPHDFVEIKPKTRMLNVFCYDGIPPSFFNFWSSTEITLLIDSNDYRLYHAPGGGTKLVQKLHDKTWFKSYLWFDFFSLFYEEKNRKEYFSIDTFDHYCLGVSTKEHYIVSLEVTTLDMFLMFMTLWGMAIFYAARRISDNPFMLYMADAGQKFCVYLILKTCIVSQLEKNFGGTKRWSFLFLGVLVVIMAMAYRSADPMIIYVCLKEHSHFCLMITLCLLRSYNSGQSENPGIQMLVQFISIFVVFHSSYHRQICYQFVVLLLFFETVPFIFWRRNAEFIARRSFENAVENNKFLQFLTRETNEDRRTRKGRLALH